MTQACARALLLLICCASCGRAETGAPAGVPPWPPGPGWAASFRVPDSDPPVRVDLWYDGAFDRDGRRVFAVAGETYGPGVVSSRHLLTIDPDGDLGLVGCVTSAAAAGAFFDPPLKILVDSLAVGRRWQSRTRRYPSAARDGPGTVELHRFAVEAVERVALPGGDRLAFRIHDDAVGAAGFGTGWFVPGLGFYGFSLGDGGAVAALDDRSTSGVAGLADVGRAVAVEFGWRPGRTIHVDRYSYRTRTNRDPDRSAAAVGDTTVRSERYDLQVSRVPEGLRVRRIRPEVAPPGPGTDILPDPGSRLTADLVVLPDGSVIDGTAGIAAPDSADAWDWSIMVGLWLGFTGKTRLPHEGTYEMPSPFGPGPPVTTEFRMAAAGFLPCRDGDEPDGCVQLNFTATADSTARGAVAAFLARTAASADLPPTVSDIRIRTDVEVVMEPGTMYPHLVRSDRQARFTLDFPDGRRREFQARTYERLDLSYVDCGPSGPPGDQAKSGSSHLPARR